MAAWVEWAVWAAWASKEPNVCALSHEKERTASLHTYRRENPVSNERRGFSLWSLRSLSFKFESRFKKKRVLGGGTIGKGKRLSVAFQKGADRSKRLR